MKAPFSDPPRPIFAHLEDLRRCLLRMGLAWALCTLAVIPLGPSLLAILVRPLSASADFPDVSLRAFRVGSGMRVLMQLTFWGGLALSLPIMIGFVARFVFPGLTPSERRLTRRLTVFSGLLFLLGIGLGYHLTLGVAVRFFLRVNAWLGVEMDWIELADYVTFAVKLLLAFGLAFELPVLLLGLGYTGLLRSESLRRSRRGVLVGVFALGMLLTPPDPMSQALLALSLYILFELCILLIWLRERTVAQA